MNIFLVLAFLFHMGSIVGYIIEAVYRKFFVAEKVWVNPGFLVGPYEPIYGVGLIILFLISLIDFSFIGNATLEILFEIVIMVVATTVLEYVTALIFTKLLHIRLWDYSDRWGNVQGFTCPVFTFLWTAICILYYFFISPNIMSAVIWFTNNIYFSFFIGFFFGILFVDLIYTLIAVRKINVFTRKHNIEIKYTDLKYSCVKYAKDKKQRRDILFPLGTHLSELNDKLEYYKEHYYKQKLAKKEIVEKE